MARGGWRRGLAELSRDVLRVLLVYALLLPMLVPVALARAEAATLAAGVHSLCSAMPQAADGQPSKTTVSVDCLLCCLVSAPGLVPAAARPTPAEVVLPLRRTQAATAVRLVPEGAPPPQRAPPRLA